MTKKEPAMTYPEALETYMGGIKGGLKCKCGYQALHVKDAWTHIRKIHGERIKNGK